MFEPSTLRHYRHELESMVRAAGDQDPEGLADLAALLQEYATDGISRAAEVQRERNGWSWAAYGKALGVSRVAAFKRLARKGAAQEA